MTGDIISNYTGITYMLCIAKYLLHRFRDKISFEQITISKNIHCMHLIKGSGEVVYVIANFKYVIQPEYGNRKDINTNNIVLLRCESGTIDIFHYMIDEEDNTLRIGKFTCINGSDIVQEKVDTIGVRTMIGCVGELINMQIGNDNKIVKYQKVLAPILNDDHMLNKMYEIEPISSIELKQLIQEI